MNRERLYSKVSRVFIIMQNDYLLQIYNYYNLCFITCTDLLCCCVIIEGKVILNNRWTCHATCKSTLMAYTIYVYTYLYCLLVLECRKCLKGTAFMQWKQTLSPKWKQAIPKSRRSIPPPTDSSLTCATYGRQFCAKIQLFIVSNKLINATALISRPSLIRMEDQLVLKAFLSSCINWKFLTWILCPCCINKVTLARIGMLLVRLH